MLPPTGSLPLLAASRGDDGAKCGVSLAELDVAGELGRELSHDDPSARVDPQILAKAPAP
jgi:hypothetical protein